MEPIIHAVGALLITLAIGIVGFFLKRGVSSIDSKLSKLSDKVDELVAQDARLGVGLAEVRTYVGMDRVGRRFRE